GSVCFGVLARVNAVDGQKYATATIRSCGASRHQRLAAPLSGRRTLEAESRTAHTSVHIVTGVHTPTEPFKGSLIRRQRHEQSLTDHRCRARDGGGAR